MDIHVSLFRDVGASKCDVLHLSADALAEKLREVSTYPDKASCPLIKLASFGDQRTEKGSLRHDGNVLQVFGIEADYDGEQISLADAQMLLYENSVSAILYTSPSHTEARPRWRVICPLSKPYPPHERARFVGRLNGALGGILAPESFTLSQAYYAGRVNGAHYEVTQVRGECIDTLDELDAKAIIPQKNGESRAERIEKVRSSDPIYTKLQERGLVVRARPDGAVDIACPFESEHTTPRAPGDCTYFPAHTGGFRCAHFHCLHSHCTGRSDDDFVKAIGAATVPISLEVNERNPPGEDDGPGDLCASGFWITNSAVTVDLPYVVKGVFGKGQLIVLWGAPGSGKTFVAMEMSCAIGSGERWHGRRTRKGIVLYVAAESARAYIENRFAALLKERPELGRAEVMVVPLALDLRNAERGDVVRVIETARTLTQERGEVVLIVIDTLAVTFGGGNENAPEDMGSYVSNVLAIREKTGAAILVVHHSGKDEAKGMRGHTALLGALDAEMAVEGGPGQERILRTGKVRDGDGQTDLFAFTLRAIELGTDKDGDPVRTCVVEAKDATGTKIVRQQRKSATLGKNQREAIRVLQERGGRMPRLDLAHKLKDDGMPRNRVQEVIAGLVQSGNFIAHNDCIPPEVSLA